MQALGAPISPMAQTGNGKHIYYQNPDEDVGSIAGFLPKMDTRGKGGYVIAPPSQHENGRRYEWLRSPDEVDPGQAPKWLTDLNSSPGRERLKECLAELAEAQEGERNAALNKAAFKAGNEVAQGRLDRGLVKKCLAVVAEHIGLGAGESEATIRSGLEAAIDKKGETEATEIVSGGDDLFELLSPSELKTLSPPEWLIDGFLPAAGFAFMYGAPGAGKSFVALDIAMSVAAGREWGGKNTGQGGALYIVGEGAIGITQRVAAWEKAHGNMKADDMRFLLQPVDASDQQMIDKLKRSIENKMRPPPALIVVDTLARCFGSSDENSARDMNTFIRNLDSIRTATGAAIMVIHHSGKDLERGERGSSALRGAADTILNLKGKKGLITLECDKQKDGKPFEPIGLTLQAVDLPGDGSS